MLQPRLPYPPCHLVVVLLLAPLLSCSTTRHAADPSSEELADFVLIIQESADGQITHFWQPAEGFDLSQYRLHSNAQSVAGNIVPAAARPRDCDQELQDCYNKCMSRPLARGYGHITAPGRKRGGKSEYCRGECWQPYQDCLEVQRLRPLEFTATDKAVDWLKRNRTAILVGSVVVIAGVVFVTVSAGAGAVVLAPIALVVVGSSLPHMEPQFVEVSP